MITALVTQFLFSGFSVDLFKFGISLCTRQEITWVYFIAAGTYMGYNIPGFGYTILLFLEIQWTALLANNVCDNGCRYTVYFLAVLVASVYLLSLVCILPYAGQFYRILEKLLSFGAVFAAV